MHARAQAEATTGVSKNRVQTTEHSRQQQAGEVCLCTVYSPLALGEYPCLMLRGKLFDPSVAPADGVDILPRDKHVQWDEAEQNARLNQDRDAPAGEHEQSVRAVHINPRCGGECVWSHYVGPNVSVSTPPVTYPSMMPIATLACSREIHCVVYSGGANSSTQTGE